MTSSAPNRRQPFWGSLLALILGLGAGIGAGLLVSWVVWPVEYTDVAPDSLYPTHREEYLVLVGQTYAYDRDLAAARARLASLGGPEAAGSEISALAERYAAQGGKAIYIQALAELAFALGYPRAPIVTYIPDETPEVATPVTPTETPTEMPTLAPTETPTATPTLVPTPRPSQTPTPSRTPVPTRTSIAPSGPTPTVLPGTPTRTPTSTHTPRPTWTPTLPPTPQPRYQVVEQDRVCDEPGGKLIVTVLDAAGQQQPNIELLARSSQGDEHFFTGLKPEIGAGYADLRLTKDVTYQVLILGAESAVAQDITADMCAGQQHLASWRVVFQWNDLAP